MMQIPTVPFLYLALSIIDQWQVPGPEYKEPFDKKYASLGLEKLEELEKDSTFSTDPEELRIFLKGLILSRTVESFKIFDPELFAVAQLYVKSIENSLGEGWKRPATI